MSGLVGSIEAISACFDGIDPKDIRQGIKECINNDTRIANAEKELIEEKQKVTIQEELDSGVLTEEIRMDMGEEPAKTDAEQDIER